MRLTDREQAPDISMKIKCIPRGPLASNMYLAHLNNDWFVIDPSVDTDSLDEEIKSLTAVLITHGHYDHIKYIDKWHSKFPDALIFMSTDDASLAADPRTNCSYMDGAAKTFDFPYEDPKDAVRFGDLSIRVIKTPGHTMGSVCYLFSDEGKDYLFTGDTIFAGSIGRTDMAGGSFELMQKSIKVIRKLSPETCVFPGHGPDSTIGLEIRYNPFFAE